MELLISAEQIQKKIAEAAEKINKDYQGKELTLVMVMKGALCFVADLIRYLQIPCRVEYIQASSYGARGSERGELVITGLERVDVFDKHLLIVDDIFDSGYTLSQVVRELQAQGPKSIHSVVLLHKNLTRDVVYRPDQSLFEIDDFFVVGYGLDYKELYRGLPGIYKVSI